MFKQRSGESRQKSPWKIKMNFWGKTVGGRMFGGSPRVHPKRSRQIFRNTTECHRQLENPYGHLQYIPSTDIHRLMQVMLLAKPFVYGFTPPLEFGKIHGVNFLREIAIMVHILFRTMIIDNITYHYRRIFSYRVWPCHPCRSKTKSDIVRLLLMDTFSLRDYHFLMA